MKQDQFVPPTPEWIKQNAGKADLVADEHGNIRYARRTDARVINYLVERDILDHVHTHYALVYEDMRNCFHRKLSNYRNSIYATEFFGSDMSNGMFETMFLRVCRRIMGTPEHCIKFAIDTDASEAHRQMAWENRHAIAAAFDKLVESIDQARKEAEDKKTIAQGNYS